MKTYLSYILSLIITFFVANYSIAQNANNETSVSNKPFVDYKPVYKKWQNNYILDKISYTKDRTIFHFRYVSHYEEGTVTYYGPGEDLAWFLKNDANPAQVFKMIEIKNIAISDIVKRPILNTKEAAVFETKQGDVFTCEVHFERLPKSVKIVDFIEGLGAEKKTNHFNCLDVEVKTIDSENLGSLDDMIDNILDFEQQVDGVLAKRFLDLTNELRKKGCHCGGGYFPPVEPIEWDSMIAISTKRLVIALWLKDGMTSDVDGKNTQQRLADVGIETEKAYENMSYSFTEIEQAFRGWKLTPPHCKRMMDARVKRIGAARKEKYWSMILIY
ncbi:hypothetical protein Fleli_2964 [Bernardetia litoralis DSM 6794]|uniref:Uncharacterized protein n=1 Tax=Bernardetia litoralis (strain ATCC 23117 / DSM 6794 / NBRC 15988 / NCIMB 1366 / Fx l1 / Sio-4) TaxID=880071 RepID=I4AMX4_BERLS|nr:CAP domain-containing protein [Bernardetia litoralis]AFM05309.1 hypothetical protein Fleli_2964 [Bernardetia litoralis DSM 6794]